MSIRIDQENMDMNEFIFSPGKITTNGIKHDLYYTRQPFYVQSPMCQVIEFNKDKGILKVQFYKDCNPKSYQLFCGLNSMFFKYTQDNYPGVEFINSVACGYVITITMKLNPNIMYFDSDKNIIISDDIKENDLVICLMKTKGLWVGDKTASMKWEAFQVLKMPS